MTLAPPIPPRPPWSGTACPRRRPAARTRRGPARALRSSRIGAGRNCAGATTDERFGRAAPRAASPSAAGPAAEVRAPCGRGRRGARRRWPARRRGLTEAGRRSTPSWEEARRRRRCRPIWPRGAECSGRFRGGLGDPTTAGGHGYSGTPCREPPLRRQDSTDCGAAPGWSVRTPRRSAMRLRCCEVGPKRCLALPGFEAVVVRERVRPHLLASAGSDQLDE